MIPTVGRATLGECLRSLSACRPGPDEVVVVVQGDVAAMEELAAAVGPPGTRVIGDPGRGISSAMNRGLAAATHPTVLVTHDDCRADPAWVGRGAALAARHPGAILTGRVLPGGDPARVPSCRTDPVPRDYTGTRDHGALYPANMVLPRDAVLNFGTFDERFTDAAEDLDFCYRWLSAGRPLRYEPELVVEHHDWRTDEQLKALYVRYARGSGLLYGKHLRRGDAYVLRFLVYDLRQAARGVMGRLVGRRRRSDPPRETLRGLPGGILAGLRGPRGGEG